ncbi:MoaF-related domain-containing protein [Gluconacetobacter sacchari]|uniref:Adenylate cyclase n=2 Tax=Gluconacetobacter sacchari TaxID=92759 RepID=A0A7W4IE36_9PROT|nr:adenylate cyclase [Gluconacetobacter sacchari]MBB2161089.1 adenylate cyclase [Gluconacetobacter sacchari]GBQ26326.1 hypothetical protein AA12717_2320 [Gluconacetobacter sacchari DSM 12717]
MSTTYRSALFALVLAGAVPPSSGARAETGHFPHAGQRVKVSYGVLTAIMTYEKDGTHVSFRVVDGLHKGGHATVPFEWIRTGPDAYLIDFTEPDRSTAIHYDDFASGRSEVFFTTPDMVFHRLHGTLQPVE